MVPEHVDARKLAQQGALITGELVVTDLPRLADALASTSGSVKVELDFHRDEQNFRVIGGNVEAKVDVLCQRCLEPMTIYVQGSPALAIVWSDDQAQALPKYLEPVLQGEDAINLWQVIEDELLLMLPMISYHDESDCSKAKGFSTDTGDEPVLEEPEVKRDNPFDVLSALKGKQD